MRRKLPKGMLDRGGREIRVGDTVRVAKALGGNAHPDFRVWIPVRGCEVVTLDSKLLRLITRSGATRK